MTLRQRSGFFVLIILIIAAELIIQFYPFKKDSSSKMEFSVEELAMVEDMAGGKDAQNQKLKEEDIAYFNFNPNALDEAGYTKLGFSAKQASSIIKYRYIKGGNFASIEEFGESYVISDEKLEKLRPYIQLSDVQSSHKGGGYDNFKKSKFNQKNIQPFDLNKTSLAGFVKLNFSERQAQTILNFKNSLPGQRFESKQQFHQCYAVNDYMYEKLEPYMRIVKSNDDGEQYNNTPQGIADKEKYNINTINQSKFVDLGFSKDEASQMIKYRAFIGGFKDTISLRQCKYVREEIYQNIKNQIIF